MISELQALRFLSLDRGKWPLMDSPFALSLELQRIQGSELKTLRLISHEGSNAFFQYSDSAFAKGQLQAIISQNSLGKSRFFDMSTRFPKLTTLKIESKTKISPKDSDISEFDFSGLPSTLTTLIAPLLVVSSQQSRVCAQLPRSLLVWKTHIRRVKRSENDEENDRLRGLPRPLISTKFWDDPPPGLHTINEILDIDQHGYRVSTTCEHLPRTIRHCHIIERASTVSANFPLNDAEADANMARIQTLPREIDHLHLSRRLVPTPTDFKDWNLPSSLTFLELNFLDLVNPQDLPMAPKLIKALPRTLTSLSYHASSYQRMDSVGLTDWNELREAIQKAETSDKSLWPPQLSQLSIKGFYLSNGLVDCLPATLTSLSGMWMDVDQMKPKLFPRALKDLSLTFTGQKHSKFASGLPEGLKSLRIVYRVKLYLHLDSWANLPASLECLELEGCQFTLEDLASENLVLPPSLKSLIVPTWSVSGFKRLPTILETLKVHHLVCDMPIETEEFSYCFMLLPPPLKTLHLRRDPDGKHLTRKSTSDRCFAHLTRLTSLKIEFIACFPKSTLLTLPISLRTLFLDILDLDKETAEYINPYLTSFQLGMRKYVVEQSELSYRYWPPEVVSRDLGETALKSIENAIIRAFTYPDPRLGADQAKAKKESKSKQQKFDGAQHYFDLVRAAEKAKNAVPIDINEPLVDSLLTSINLRRLGSIIGSTVAETSKAPGSQTSAPSSQ